jgi:hypothetical protein
MNLSTSNASPASDAEEKRNNSKSEKAAYTTGDS